MRASHQPFSVDTERVSRTAEERARTLLRIATFVLATGRQAADCVGEVVDTAVRSKSPAVFVLASPEAADEVAQAVYSARRAGKGGVLEVLAIDPAAVREATREAADFELFGIPQGLLGTMSAMAESVLPDYEAILVLDGGMGAVTADHLCDLVDDFHANDSAQVVASWIQWVRRFPYVISRDFLDQAGSSGLFNRLETGHRPVPQISVIDHLFGEEKLAAPVRAPQAVESLLEGATMSALEAVTLAKWVQEHPDETPASPNQPQSLIETAEPLPLSDADRELLDIALEVTQRDGGAVRAEMEWADRFAQRNRLDFPLLNDRAHAGKLAYLDSAATSQRLGCALQAQADFDAHENANVYRGAYELSAQATFTLNAARKRLEDWIGAERRSTVLCANTTAACNIVAQSWGEWNIGSGDRIVTSIAEHHSTMLPFVLLAERKGAVVDFLPLDEQGRISQKAYAEALERRPKLVAIAHVGNVLGIEAPVKQMARAAHDAGARFLLDAAQSFPHCALDVGSLGADWVAFSAHKAYGPLGIGALWISPDAFAEMDPLASGGGAVSHVGAGTYYLRAKALQYELGTPPISQAVGWAAAIDYLDRLGMDNIARHAAACTAYLADGLGAIDGVSVLGDHTLPDGQSGLVAFALCGVSPSELASFLGKLGVAIRAGSHCAIPLHASLGLVGSGRISVAVHTTRDDLDAALVAIEACRRAYGRREIPCKTK